MDTKQGMTIKTQPVVVGCERPDGTLNFHSASEVCEVCSPRVEAAQAPPASAPQSMPEPSPARAGYPYTDAGDRVMAERFPASDPPGLVAQTKKD